MKTEERFKLRHSFSVFNNNTAKHFTVAFRNVIEWDVWALIVGVSFGSSGSKTKSNNASHVTAASVCVKYQDITPSWHHGVNSNWSDKSLCREYYFGFSHICYTFICY